MVLVQFTTRDGEVLTGKIVHQYRAFEGGQRYIIVAKGQEYRCVFDSTGHYVEYVA